MAKGVNNTVRMDLLGANELAAAMESLPVAMRKQVLLKAVRKSGRILHRPLRRATPKSKKGSKSPKKPPSGTLRKSTGTVVRKYRGGSLVSAYVGHKWPKGAAAHLVEKGTKNRQTKRGYNRGAAKPRPFFQPVYDSHKAMVEAALRDELAIGLKEAQKKAALKALKKAKL